MKNLTKVRGRQPKGFTLVELLVCMGIIAAMMGILLTVISKSRKSASNVQCTSNLQQLARACLMHAAEHRGYVPLAGQCKAIISSSDWNDRTDAFTVAVNDTSRARYTYATYPQWSNRWVAIPFLGALSPYLGGSKLDLTDVNTVDSQLSQQGGVWRFFMCPETDSMSMVVKNNGGYLLPQRQGTMFVMSVANDGSQPFSDQMAWSSNMDYVVNEGVTAYRADDSRFMGGLLSKAKRPSEVVLMTDGQRRPTWATYFMPDGWQTWTPRPDLLPAGSKLQPISLADSIVTAGQTALANDQASFDRKRHGAKGNQLNIAFCDGHVEARDITVNSLRTALLLP